MLEMQELFILFIFSVMLSWSGMLIIIVSWLIQLNYSRKGRKEIQPAFLVLQALGIFMIVIGSFANGEIFLWFLNLISAAGAARVYLKTKK